MGAAAEPNKPWSQRLPEPLHALIFGGNTLVKVGVLLLFLGLAFLLRYAAERVTVPVPLRYAGVALVGAVLLGLGWWLRSRRTAYALILQGAGIGVFYLTTLAAMKLHNLIEPSMGFAFMLAVSVLSGVLAVLQNARALAVVAALEGFAAPVLVSTGSTHPLGLFIYLSVLNTGLVGIAWFKAWRPLHLIGMVGTLTLAGGWAQQRYLPEHYAITQTFLIVFMLMYGGIGLMFARRSLSNQDDLTQAQASLFQRAGLALQRVGRVDSALVFGVPLSAFGMQYLLVQDQPLEAAVAAMGFGLFYLVLARLALSGGQAAMRLLAEAYAIVAVLFGTLAIPLGLEGKWTGAAWAVEAAGMFWLGLRQQRPYARLFALVVLAGAGTRLLSELGLSMEPDTPWLSGSVLGPVLLLGSVLTVYVMARKQVAESAVNAPALLAAQAESLGLQALPWLAAFALTLLPYMLLPPIVAPAALAALALLVHALSKRRTWPEWQPVVVSMQALSVVALLAAVQRASSVASAGPAIEEAPAPKPIDLTVPLGSSDLPGATVPLPDPQVLVASSSQAVLADGWLAVLSTVFIAATLMGAAWLSARSIWRTALDQGKSPVWTLPLNLRMLSGALLLHLAVLFVAPWLIVALVWPILALLSLVVGVRGVVLPMLALSAGAQLSAAALAWCLYAGFLPTLSLELGHFSALSWVCLVQAGVALVCAAVLQASGARCMAEPKAALSCMRAPLAWTYQGLMRWLPMGAGLLWGLLVLSDELHRWLVSIEAPAYFAAAWVALLVLVSAAMRLLAVRRHWPELGAASYAVLPGFLLALALAVTEPLVRVSGHWLPSQHGGWWAWPLALLWHLWVLRRWPAHWPGHQIEPFLHAAGLWFFTALAGWELHSQLALLSGDQASTWALLGGVAVVAGVLFGLAHPGLRQRWPLSAQPQAYAFAALPLAVFSGVCIWAVNVSSDGSAAPLPYLPLLNPLELGMGVVVLALLMWQRGLPLGSLWRPAAQAKALIAGSTGLALLTGMVLRVCHHWADVPWQWAQIWASTLAQASVSMVWALSGVVAMLLANRRGSRSVWLAGAVLLGVVVLKLFVVELADHGGIYRIVSFIGVGVLLLLVGYFAPVPGRSADTTSSGIRS